MGNNNLLKRLKNLAREQGEVLLADEESGDLFALTLIEGDDDFTEVSVKSDCGADCGCSREIAVKDINNEIDEDVDKNLMERVNEDIAKWREEQKSKKEPKKDEVLEKDEPTDLTEEERYYLEPLE